MADMERMQVITSNIDDIRNLTNCKICLKPYYEPYILACGHTYCYSCLRSWFGGLDQRRKKKNCPDCRAEVVTQPAPNYLLRDLVHIFIGRAELLPEDESLEEHARGKHDEAKQLSNDRKAGGLFQGIFPPRIPPPIRPGPIRDLEDNVLRCPLCAFELEEGECNNCGWYPQFPESDSYSDESVDGLFSDEGQSVDEEVPRHPQFFGPASESDDSDSEANHYDTPHDYGVDLDHYDEEDDFIDNGEVEEDLPDEVDYDENGEVHTDFSSDDDGDVSLVLRRFDDVTGLPAETVSISNQSDAGTIYDDSESEMASPTSPLAQATSTQPTARRGRQAVVISDDEDEDEADEDNDEEDPDQSPQPARRTRRMIFDEEESLDSDSNMSGEDEPESDSDNTENSEDTAIPPTTRAERQQRLVNHRSRRPTQGRAIDELRPVSNSASDSETQRRILAARQHMAHTMGAAGRRTARTSTYVH